jgi:hypothetical protein
MKAITILFLATSACSLPLNGTGPDDLFDDAGQRIGSNDNSDAADDAAPVCHPAVARGVAIIMGNTASCTAVTTDANVINDHAVGYIVSNPMLDCSVHEVPVECSTCNYTCGCLLQYVATPGMPCKCSQESPGAPIVLTGCGG